MAFSNGNQRTVTAGLIFAADPSNPMSWASPSSTDANDLITPTITGSLENGTSGVSPYWDFDGSNDYIKFPDADIILPDSPYTFIMIVVFIKISQLN